jgi:hypothetical protein
VLGATVLLTFTIRNSTQCESGGIGRRTRLRIWRRKAWGFESPLSHQMFEILRPSALRISPAGSRFAHACKSAQLRIWRRKAWGFESPLSHQAIFEILRASALRISPAGSRFAHACKSAQLRIWRRKAWGFESPLSHQMSLRSFNAQTLSACSARLVSSML